jgi:CubicO group peptidase (beta-lactamase class C family)
MRSFLCSIFLLASLCCAALPGLAETTAEMDTAVETHIDAIFQPLVTASSPGCAVLVIKDGKQIFAKGYGLADLGSAADTSADKVSNNDAETPAHEKKAIDEHTNFRLASFTKQFTAMAIMLLAKDGKLRYGDPLSRFFPEFPAYGRAITVRQLLTHTSGLPDYEDLWETKFPNRPTEQNPHAVIPQISDAEVLKLLEQQQVPMFAAGSRWHYSNSGYVVLGLIVAKVSGTSFPDFLKQRTFDPLGMRNTVAFVNGKNYVAHRAFGYRKGGNGGWEFADQSPTSATLGDGGIYSSLDDLAKWDAALQNHTLLSADEMQPALTPVRVPGGARREDGTPVEYGFGWFLDSYRGAKRMYHDGETSGFRTSIQRFIDGRIDKRLTVIVLANRTDLNPNALALRVADLFGLK